MPPCDCGETALTVFAEPTMTVRVNGATADVPFTAISSPDGFERNERSTVCGLRRTLVVADAPSESVAVSRSSRCDGYSWSGAVNEPLATFANDWSGCAWQFDGQWFMTSSHESDDAGRAPSCGSVAEPENETRSPTRQVSEALGELMTGTGGALLPAFTTTAPTEVAPGPSVTRSRTVTVFVCVYVKEGCAAVESPNVPSPSRSQE